MVVLRLCLLIAFVSLVVAQNDYYDVVGQTPQPVAAAQETMTPTPRPNTTMTTTTTMATQPAQSQALAQQPANPEQADAIAEWSDQRINVEASNVAAATEVDERIPEISLAPMPPQQLGSQRTYYYDWLNRKPKDDIAWAPMPYKQPGFGYNDYDQVQQQYGGNGAANDYFYNNKYNYYYYDYGYEYGYEYDDYYALSLEFPDNNFAQLEKNKNPNVANVANEEDVGAVDVTANEESLILPVVGTEQEEMATTAYNFLRTLQNLNSFLSKKSAA